MKPIGEWQEERQLSHYVLRVGSLTIAVKQHFQTRRWSAWEQTWVPNYGLSFSTLDFGTREEAMLHAEERVAYLVGEAVREASRMGLYGRRRDARRLRRSGKGK